MANKKVVTGKVRLSYVNIFEPRAAQEGAPKKYSVCVMIPKKDKATVKAFQDAQAEVAESSKESHFKGKTKGIKMPLRDGDEEKDDPNFAGHYFFNASSNNQPLILDEEGSTVLDSREVYSGCYARVSVNLYPFNNTGNMGIAAGLNAVKKVEDGDPLGGVYTEEQAKEDFDDDMLD